MGDLQQSWNEYLRVPLDASARQEKLVELERFLGVVLRSAALSQDDLQFSDMRSVSNILAGEFLVDVHRICSESADDDISQLKDYLLLSRGGVILRVLNTIGVEQLSSSKELADLLVSLLPLCLKFPNKYGKNDSKEDVCFAQMEACFSHLPYVAQSPASRKIKLPALTEVPSRFRGSNNGSNKFSAGKCISRSTSQRSCVHGSRGDPSSSLSDSDNEQIPPTFHSTKYRRTFTAPSLMQSSLFHMGVYQGILKRAPDDASSEDDDDPAVDPLQPMELCLLLLTVLRDLCFDDQPSTSNEGSVSVAILPHLTQLLLSLQSESSEHGWTADDCGLLQRYCVRVLMTMAAQVTVQPHGITVLRSHGSIKELFSIASSIVNALGAQEIKESAALSRLLFAHDIVHGVWLLLKAVFACIPLNPSVLNTSLKLFFDVLNEDGLQLVKSLLIRFEAILQDGKADVQMARDSIKSLLVALSQSICRMKSAKVDYIHMIKCTKQRHQKCDFSHHGHHHHDIMGAALPEPPVGSNPDDPQPCGVATVCHFLLLLMQTATTRTLKQLILKSLDEAGVCCCILPCVVLEFMMEDLSLQPFAFRASVLSTLMRVLIDQSGGGSHCEANLLLYQADPCYICHVDSPAPSPTNGRSIHEPALSLAADAADKNRWSCVHNLLPLILANDDAVSTQVITHALRLVSQGCSALKQELFTGVFLPILQATKQHFLSSPSPSLSPSLSVVHCCLSALPVLLQSQSICTLFLSVGGVQQLAQLVCISSLRSCVLRVFQVLIILEDRRELALSPPSPLHDETSGSTVCLRHFLLMLFIHLGILKSNNQDQSAIFHSASQRKSEDIESELKSSHQSLAKFCDLWETCDELFSQSRTFAQFFIQTEGVRVCRQTLNVALLSLIECKQQEFSLTLLFNKDRSSELGCWLALFQATLSLSLSSASSPYAVDILNSEEDTVKPLMEEITACLSTSCLVSQPHKAGLLKLVCDMLLQTATRHRSASDVIFTHTFSLMHLRREESSFDHHDMSESSSRDTETCLTEQGYEADSEVTDFVEEVARGSKGKRKLLSKKRPLRKAHVNSIIYPELCRLALDLIISHKHCHNQPSHENAVVLHTLLRLLSLAKLSDSNARALCSQDLIDVLLNGFKHTLASREPEDQVEKRLVLSIFETIASQQFSAQELHQFLSLFKEEGCCYDGLLTSLIHLSYSFKCQPSHVIRFPVRTAHCVSDLELSVRSLGDDMITASIRPVSTSEYSSRTSLDCTPMTSSSIETTDSVDSITVQSIQGSSQHSPSKLSPLQLAMHDHSLWPSNKSGFSISLWLLIESPHTSKSREDNTPFTQMLAMNSSEYSSFKLPAKLRASMRRTIHSCQWSDTCLHLVSIGNQELMLEVWSDPNYPNLIFRMVTHSKGEEKVLNQVALATRLVHDRWQHLSLAFCERSKDGRPVASITTIINGTYQKETLLDYSSHYTPSSLISADSLVLLGHSIAENAEKLPGWQLGNLMLFKDCKLSKHASFHIYALGPDCLSLTQTDCSDMHVDYSHLISEELVQQSGLSHDIFTGTHSIFMQHLRDSLVLIYHPKTATSFHMYSRAPALKANQKKKTRSSVVTKEASVNNSSLRLPLSSPLLRQPVPVPATTRLMLMGMDSRPQHGLASAVDENGGIGVFLFLFAKVVENCACERYQAEALQLLLNLIQRDPRHALEFISMSGYAMLAKVLRSKRCVLGHQMLKVLLDASLSRSILLQRRSLPSPTINSDLYSLPTLTPGEYYLDTKSTAVIKNVRLITDVLLAWRSWEHADEGVWDLLFLAIEVLVQPSNPQRQFNIRQLQQANLVKQLLNICLERIQEASPALSHGISCSLVNIVRHLLGSPPDLHAVISLCDFLLLAHPAASTYVSHSADEFYFSHKWGKKSESDKSSEFTGSGASGRQRSFTTPVISTTPPLTSTPVPKKRRDTDVAPLRPKSKPIRKSKSCPNIAESAAHLSVTNTRIPEPELQRTKSLPQMPRDPSLNSDQSEVTLIDILTPPSDTPVLRLNDHSPEDSAAASSEGASHSPQLSPMGTGPSGGSSDDWVMYPNPASMKSIHMKTKDIILREINFEEDDGNDEGSVALSVGVLDLLTSLVSKLSPSEMSTLHGVVLQWERLVILAHHRSASVRAAVIRLLDVFLHQANHDQIAGLLRLECFQLLAAQLHRHHATTEMLDACLTMLMGRPQSIEEDIQLQLLQDISPVQQNMIVLFLALVNPSLHDMTLCHNLLFTLHKLFTNIPCLAKSMLNNGLVEVLCNLIKAVVALPPCFTDLGNDEKLLLYLDIQVFFRSIGQYLFNTSGLTIWQQLEDTYTMLIALEVRLAEQHGQLSQEVSCVREIICIYLHAILEHVSEKLDTPANLQLRTASTISSAVGSLLQWRTSPNESTEDLTSSINRLTMASQDIPLATMSSSSSGFIEREEEESPQLFKSNGIPDTFLNFPKFKRSVSATIGEYGQRLRAAGLVSGSWVNEERLEAKVNDVTSGQKKDGKDLTQAELLERLKKLIVLCTDFVLYSSRGRNTDDDCNSDESESDVSDCAAREISLGKILLQFITKCLSASLENSFFRRKTLSASVMWQAKDVLKVHFSRLFVYQVAIEQTASQRLFALDLISQEPKMEALLRLTMPINQAGIKAILYFTNFRAKYSSMMSRGQRNNVTEVLRILNSCMQTPTKAGGSASDDYIAQLDEESVIWNRQLQAESLKWRQHLINAKLRVFTRNQPLVKRVSESAMIITQQVNNTQSQQRKVFLDHIKRILSEGLQVKKHWQGLIQQLAHERGIWHCARSHPLSWQLDNTEGPSRVRKRLQRCHLSIEKRFLHNEQQNKLVAESVDPPLAYIFEDEDLGADSAALIYKLHTNETISFTCMCMNVTPSTESPGALLIGQSDLYFVADAAIKDANYTQVLLGNRDELMLTLAHEDIKEVHTRWYQLRDHGLEIFLTNGKTHLLAFDTTRERDELFKQLMALELPNRLPTETLTAVMQLWIQGQMTNFEYLTYLNKVAGRTFNDLMQYPVFPFIITNYNQDTLDLGDTDSYRNFAKPIAVQHIDREQRYRDNYKWLALERQRQLHELSPDPHEYRPEPYHYGSHYSNSGTVLHFLVRLPPFTQMFLHYQDNNFDIPDRTFHALHTSWHLASFQSTTDVKELIPEFFFLPEFLTNYEGFAFGRRQNGEDVDNVHLPPWCNGDARLFTLVHAQALESDYVTQHLPEWIDLVFGYKQKGKAAIDAINVFHPATYFGIDVDSIEDPVRRSAMKTMIKTYGQTPKQLFRAAHPAPNMKLHREPHTLPDRHIEPLRSVRNLRWGPFLGSPDLPEPVYEEVHRHGATVTSLVALPTGEVFGLGPRSCLLVMCSKEKGLITVRSTDVQWAAIVSWGHSDGVLRVRNKRDLPAVNFLHWRSPDSVTCCASVPDCRQLFFGSSSGTITVIHTKYNSHKQSHLQVFSKREKKLYGHKDSVNALSVCKPFSVMVSASADTSCIIWDLNRLMYVQSIFDHKESVTVVATSETSGDIATVSQSDGQSCLMLHTINAKWIATHKCKEIINCLAFSTAPEGRAVNVVAGGLSSGVIRLWSSWDLTVVQNISRPDMRHPMNSICFSHDSRRLFAANADGRIVMWSPPGARQLKVTYVPFL